MMKREDFSENAMKRALVIGSPGAGKSTFARKLRDQTGLPLYYLDRLYHRADRTTATPEEFDRGHDRLLALDEWIIDGNYLRTLPLRLQACDSVFFFDLPAELCLSGAASRIGTAREDMPWTETCFDPVFRQYIIDFPRDQLPQIRRLLAACPPEKSVILFRSREESEAWLAGLPRREAGRLF